MKSDPKIVRYLDQGKLPPAIERAIRLTSGLTQPVTLEELQAIHDQEREEACRQLDELAKQFHREDEERVRLWGKKYPPVIGAKPPQNGNGKPEGVNPVKPKANRRRRK